MTYAEKLQNSGNFMINESWEIRNINESYSDDDDLMVGGCFALCWLSDKNNNLLRYKPQSIQTETLDKPSMCIHRVSINLNNVHLHVYGT